MLYLKIGGSIYIPLYDANGNITKYLDSNGNVTASYTYDAFGNLLHQAGDLVDSFTFRFSTKYFDRESNLYYYGKRFYSPSLRRWLTRDPIEERGGRNIYAFCKNNPLANFDSDGCAYFAVRRLSVMPAIVKWSSVVCPVNASFGGTKSLLVDLLSDWLNVELLHEQLFFEDDRSDLTSVGWGGENGGSLIKNERMEQYTRRDGGYDDCIMRMAVSEVKFTHYQLTWIGGKTKCNCQDYADALRAKYREIAKRKDAKCECKEGSK